MKTIILPTDFSENSWRAICYAITLFGNKPCKYIVINCFSVPNQYLETGVGNLFNELKKASDENLEEMKDRMEDLDFHKDSSIELLAEYGYVTTSLMTLEDKGQVDYIVMGTKGISGLGEYFLGTITTDVIEKCKTPIVCVPFDSKLNAPKKIAVSLDENGLKYVSAIKTLMEIGKSYNAEVDFVYVVEGELFENEEVREADKFVIDTFYDFIKHDYTVIQGKYVEDELMQYIHRNQIDLMCMIKHDKGVWKNLFHRSLSKTMAFHTDTPLLILHD